MKIYLDAEYLCHAENTGGYTEYETDIFDGKGRHYIECFRIVPEGKRWTRADGAVFQGFMMAQAKPVEDAVNLDAMENKIRHDELKIKALTDELAVTNDVLQDLILTALGGQA